MTLAERRALDILGIALASSLPADRVTAIERATLSLDSPDRVGRLLVACRA